jgi:hypothetical protein
VYVIPVPVALPLSDILLDVAADSDAVHAVGAAAVVARLTTVDVQLPPVLVAVIFA